MKYINFSLVLLTFTLTSFFNKAVAQEVDPSRLFFDDTWEAKIFNNPENSTDKTLLTSGNTSAITINLNDEINKINPTVLGMNTTFRSNN